MPKLLLSANEAPHYKDISGAIGERLIILNAPNQRKEDQRDPFLLDKLATELGAFAASCIRAALQTLLTGMYPKSLGMRQALARVSRIGSPLRMFIDDYCILGAAEKETSAALYQEYTRFCEESGHKALARNNLTTALEEMNIGIVAHSFKLNGKPVRGLKGIRLRTDDDPDPEPDELVYAVYARDTHQDEVRIPEISHPNAVNQAEYTQYTHFEENAVIKINVADSGECEKAGAVGENCVNAYTTGVLPHCNALNSGIRTSETLRIPYTASTTNGHTVRKTHLTTKDEATPRINADKVRYVLDKLPIRGAAWARDYMGRVEGFEKWPHHLQKAVHAAEQELPA
jgi:hypothetical protein